MRHVRNRIAGLILGMLCMLLPAQMLAIDPTSDQIIMPATQHVQAKPGDTSARPMDGVQKTAVIFVLLLIGAGAIFFFARSRRRLGARLSQSARGAIDICRVRTLGGKEYLAVVQVEGKRLLLGIGPTFMTKLCELEPEDFSIPYERKDDNGGTKPTKPAETETPSSFPFTNLITRINESLSRKDPD